MHWPVLRDMLRTLDAGSNSFIVFEHFPDKHYLQVAGSADEMVCEIRRYEADGADTGPFRHVRLARSALTGRTVQLGCPCGPIIADEAEVLTRAEARKALRYFLDHGCGIDPSFVTVDITAMFA